MNCPICKYELKNRHRIDEAGTGIVYPYFYCVRDDKKFDKNLNEIKEKITHKKTVSFEDGKLKIVGFEVVRRNWSALAKEVQEKVLQMVLDEKVKEALQYVRQVISELKSGKIEKKKLHRKKW